MLAASGHRKWWAEEPVESSAGDLLDRGDFAGRLADVLNDIALEPASTVIGLVGPWGSGKSSTLNLTRRLLKQPPWTVVDINPWALPGPEYVIAEVLAAISEALAGRRSQARKLRRKLAGYARYAIPLLPIVPFAGQPVADFGTAILNDIVAGGTQPERARQLNDLLDEIKPRILVTVDDVDRLQPEELLALFRAIRVLGRLHRVHYLLSYDEQTVLALLDQTAVVGGGSSRALDFLEKIVTVRLDQPPTREEQAAELFDRQLQLLLEDLQVGMTEDQQSRLTLEREAFFSASLTEPRRIRRFFTQMHAYLPLVGSEEIDPVDFMVLSFLRTTWPRLYEQLRLARRKLADPDLDRSQLREDWGQDRLAELDVPVPSLQRCAEALARLFPLLSEIGLTPDESRRRRAGLRVSDLDYVDRYFALTPPSDDVSDSYLRAALGDLAMGNLSERSRRLSALLCPDGANRNEWDRAARLYRRAAASAHNLTPDVARRLLLAGLAVVPAALPQGVPASALGAAEAWVGELLMVAEMPSHDELNSALQMPPDEPSKLATLVSALRLAVGRVGADQFQDLIDYTVQLSWQRLVTNIRLSDAAPHERTSLLLSWIRGRVTDDELRNRIVVELRSGLGIEDLAARLMLTGRGSSGYDAMLDLDRNSARVLLMLKETERQLDDLRRSAPDPPAEPDKDDVSWPSLRKAGTAEVLRELSYHGSTGQTQISAVTSENLLGFHPALLPSLPAGMTAHVNVLLPFGLRRPELAWLEDDEQLDAREQLLVGLMNAAAVTRWAKKVTQRRSTSWRDWQISANGGRGMSVAQAGADSLQVNSVDHVPEVALSAQLQPEPTSGPDDAPRLLLSVGVYLRADSAVRLSLVDFYEFLMALIQLSETARGAWSLTNQAPAPGELAQTIELTVTAATEDLLEVEHLFRIAGASARQLVQSVKVEIWPADTDPDPEILQDFATKCLITWLRDSGYRNNVEEVASAAAQAYRSLSLSAS